MRQGGTSDEELRCRGRSGAARGWAARSAQSFPSRPITMIVPLRGRRPDRHGGAHPAEGMRRTLGQPIMIENVSGAAGNVGAPSRAVRSTPDGYTLSFGT